MPEVAINREQVAPQAAEVALLVPVAPMKTAIIKSKMKGAGVAEVDQSARGLRAQIT